jgi:hypothetical protein
LDDDVDDDIDHRLEWKLRAIAIPAAFVLALVFHAWSTGHWLQRTFLTMVPHELGHAITAWWSGIVAFPSLWKTLIHESRSVVMIVLVGGAIAGLAVYAWRAQRNGLVGVAIVLAAGQVLLTTSEPATAQAAIAFGGDAGAMVIGTLLVLAFFTERARRGAVRWGLLVIGAAAFTDTFATWWSARTDERAIPFGEIEGVGLSDPTKLRDVYHWSTHAIVGRYVALGAGCLLVIAAVTAWAAWTSRRRALEAA